MNDARLTVSPLRRQLLDRLQRPGSATQLATELGVGRQRVNYHLRALEQAGLVELVEERQRRGFVERVLQVRSVTSDRHASERLIVTAADVVRDVTRMRDAAAEEGALLLTFTIETELSVAGPDDLIRFSDALAAAIGRLVAEFAPPPPTGGTGRSARAGTRSRTPRRYRLIAGGYPAPRTEGKHP